MKRLGFTIGITLVLSLIFLNIICSDLVTLILAITALLVFLLFLLFIKNKARAFVLVRTVSFTVLVASLLFYCTYTLTYKANSEVYGSSVNLEGVLYEQPLEYESGTFGYVIKPTNVNVKGKILVYSKEKLDADIYQNISLEVKISNLNKKPPLDESYNRAKGIYLTASYLSNFENKGLTNKLPLRYYFLKGKNFVVTTLNSVTNGSIATAIMTSDKTELPNEHKQLFKAAGVSHLMATSGFHLSLLASILFLLLSIFKLPKKIKIAVVMIVSVLFAAFIGFPPSITRALIMLLVFYFGTFFYVEVDSLNSLGIAATLICLLNPFSVLDIGFILSFMATIGILTVPDEFNIFTYRLKYKTKIIGKTLFSTIISTTITSLYAIIFTAPFIIFYFGSLPLYAILGNIVGVLFAPVIVILGIFAIIFAKIPFVFAFLSKALTFVIDGFLSILRAITSLPNANIYAGYTVVLKVLKSKNVFFFF
ncbi:MAG: ComEC/Rec2 family competence protein [Clostridia bacterium]